MKPDSFRLLLRAGLAVLGCLAGRALATEAAPAFSTRYEKLLELKPEEGVFAYSRISPDGEVLSFASEIKGPEGLQRTVNFIDVKRRKVLFTEPGIDANWSPDGKKIVYLSNLSGGYDSVSIWHRDTGEVIRHVAPPELGDYYSWANDAGRDLVLTRLNRYYYLVNDRAIRPYRQVQPYPGVAAGAQPMISRDGRLIATFVDSAVVVRGLIEEIPPLFTHLPGGKADFSHDGRYIAFHTVKDQGRTTGYEIVVVDLQEKKFIRVTNLPGSAYYPSWTRDGRLSFRYDSETYRGFLMASDFLKNPAEPLPTAHVATEGNAPLQALYNQAPPPKHKVVLVNFWAGWCVHCRGELPVLDQIRRNLRAQNIDCEIVGACEPSSFKSDRDRVIANAGLSLPQVDITAQELIQFGILVFPTNLLFVDGKLVERRYGQQTHEQFVEWLGAAGVHLQPAPPAANPTTAADE